MNDIIATMTIFGQLPSLKNRRRLILGKGNRRPMIIKSRDAMDYERAFLMAIPQRIRVGYAGPVSIKVRVWYRSRRNDLSTELLFDLIAKAGIIANDRQIMHCECWKGLSKESPRVHFTMKKWKESTEPSASGGRRNAWADWASLKERSSNRGQPYPNNGRISKDLPGRLHFYTTTGTTVRVDAGKSADPRQIRVW